MHEDEADTMAAEAAFQAHQATILEYIAQFEKANDEDESSLLENLPLKCRIRGVSAHLQAMSMQRLHEVAQLLANSVDEEGDFLSDGRIGIQREV